MVDKDDYLKDPSAFQGITKFRHAEHIIQNALYGRLTDDTILCETCGTKLSEKIDADFVKLFDLFTVPISHILASKDHGNNLNKTLRGYIIKHDGQRMEIQLVDGRLAPRKPDYDFIKEDNLVKIYAHSGAIQNYKNYVLKQLGQSGVDVQSLKIELIDDIRDYSERAIHFSEGVENFNLKIKLGLNKIATGFAASHGIARNDMPCTIDTANNEVVFTTNVVSFYPYAALDLVIEPFRVALEDEFPTHTLMLYTDRSFGKTKLVCYLDLFSTFQFYVILNHDYQGAEINKTYYQTIIKQRKPEIDIRKVRWKHLNIVADGIGVDKKEMAGMTIEEMYDFLEKKYKQLTIPYTLDINEYVRKVASRVAMNLLIRKKGITGHLTDLEKEILDATPDLDDDDLLCLYHEINRSENVLPELYFKKEFIELAEDRTPVLFSTLAKMIELQNAAFDGFKSYGHSKFLLLSHFVNINEKESQPGKS